MASTVVLISGANRGLGKGLLELYLAKPNHIVIAANRNPDHPTSKALAQLPKGEDSRLIVIKVDASVESDASEGIKQLIAQGIDHIDIAIANAGVLYCVPKVSEVKTEELQGHLTPNVFGVVWLFQAALPLLKNSTNPKWITLGSVGGKIVPRDQPDVPHAAYGPSKVAAHWITKRIDKEEDWLTAFVLSPGLADTDMARVALKGLSSVKDKIPVQLVPVEESCKGMVKVIDVATKATHGGRFMTYTGDEDTW
ncbi:NAD(P)-binding protein [Daldinia caldariorum]|uniref:NAD(P)-binding protein n=1 Tax=Daldinia caldariorum TaxID=326644 RepID=UPI002008A632|nr:NAD(P)-binding protein [Daldinia caldariorum]KAI1464952.1 NAD(P)-binding protein [Daldinia caldariorum]